MRVSQPTAAPRTAPAYGPRIALLAVLLVGLPLLSTDAAAAKEKKSGGKLKERIAALPAPYRDFVESVELLLGKDELEVFLEIEKDYQRDAFIERFWRSRDPYPQTARNEFRDNWLARVALARELYGDLDEDRSRVLLLNGQPDALVPIDCVDLWPAEVWYYQRAENVGMELAILFYQPGGLGAYRLWYPDRGTRELVKFPFSDFDPNCSQRELDAIGAVLSVARAQGPMGFTTLAAELMSPPKPPSGEWVATFQAYDTDLPEDAATFEAAVEISYPSRYQSRTLVQVVLGVGRADASLSQLSTSGSYNFRLVGEVVREDKLFDNFQYRFNLPAPEVEGETIPLVFERPLRAGDYLLILKLEDLNGGRLFRAERELAVPAVEPAPATPADPETARLLAEANAAISSGDTTLQLVEPRGQLQTGMVRLDTLTTGADIAEVTFELDGRPVLTKRSPPFSVELDLGSLPRMRTVSAAARDAAGREVARDELLLNAGSHRFDVRLVEPRPGGRYRRSVRAETEVLVPEGGTVERVEFYLDESLVAALYQPPWSQPIVLPPTEEMAYVRAVAYQPDGNYVEDTVFINAPDYLENLEVQFVELYISVLDQNKRPVAGLTAADFTVLEDGVEQEPRRFDVVTNLPIHAGILLDVSASMEADLELAQLAALEFFRQVVTPRDRATLVTFNDHPNLAVKFTNDLDSLAGGLAGLKAERGTALYDSVIFALYYFNGIKGQRALILLSDGRDEHSSFGWEDTLEYARRAGVAIYSIGLNLPRKQLDQRRKLTRLAEETGGRSFFVDGAGELGAVYDEIQRELRSRYYLAYQSTNTADDEAFRTIDVEVAGRGLEAKTLRGYYP